MPKNQVNDESTLYKKQEGDGIGNVKQQPMIFFIFISIVKLVRLKQTQKIMRHSLLHIGAGFDINFNIKDEI